MKCEPRILARSAVAMRPPRKRLTPFARHRGSIGGGTNHLNCLRQGTALAVPKSGWLRGFQPLRRFESSAEPAQNVIEGLSAPQITRHTVPSNFPANSLKTKKSGPHYSTHNSRGREIAFRTSNLIVPPKFAPVRVNY
jgi:hypothetical protein